MTLASSPALLRHQTPAHQVSFLLQSRQALSEPDLPQTGTCMHAHNRTC